uniref:Hypothetical secreted protein n=1 Tax=Simulium vittatum TaxID=7192 RepID=B5M0X4_SIMVI|nr:hypothetical secreted protein [Simulium vittatum]
MKLLTSLCLGLIAVLCIMPEGQAFFNPIATIGQEIQKQLQGLKERMDEGFEKIAKNSPRKPASTDPENSGSNAQPDQQKLKKEQVKLKQEQEKLKQDQQKLQEEQEKLKQAQQKLQEEQQKLQQEQQKPKEEQQKPQQDQDQPQKDENQPQPEQQKSPQ